MSFNFGSCLVHLFLVAFKDLHEDDVSAENTYVQRQMTNRDNCLFSLEAYGFFDQKEEATDFNRIVNNVSDTNEYTNSEVLANVLKLLIVELVFPLKFLHGNCSREHN